MNLRRTKAMARKEFLHVLRDRRSLAMAIAIPMLLLLLFGYALTLDVDNVPLVVWDQSNTPASRDLIGRFDGSPYYAINSYASSYGEVVRAIDAGNALAALVVPRDFGAQTATGLSGRAQMLMDGSDANTALLARGYADAIALGYSQEVLSERIEKLRGERIKAPVEIRSRVWFNSELQSRYFIIPGLIAMIMMVIAALLTSLTVAREWERGTMEQLISTPVLASELIVGKLIPYFAIGMFDVFLAILMAEFLFHVPLRGSTWLVFFMAAIFLAGALSLGILISIVTKNQLVANQLAMVVTYLPAFLLSGLMFSINNMPAPVQAITHIVPARYFISLLRGIYLKGMGAKSLLPEILLLSAFSVAIFLLALLKFKKKLV